MRRLQFTEDAIEMQRPLVSRSIALAAMASIAVSGCTRLGAPTGPQPQTTASTVDYVPFGPARPQSGFQSSGSVISQDNSGVFGTADTISVTDSGPFPADGGGFDASLADLSLDDRALLAGTGLDLESEAALASSLTFPGDTGSPAFFDASIGTTVNFATDSSALSDEARETLRSQAAWLTVNSDVLVTVEGHTDERGTREYNLALGERRASATRGYLLALGVAPDRVRKVSYGKERPAVTGSDESAWRQNRRTVTVIANGGGGVSSLSDLIPSASTAPAGSVDDLLNDPLLNDASFNDPLLGDPLLNDPLLNDPLLNDPLLDG